MTAAGARAFRIRLEAIRILDGKLLFGLLQPGKERGALDANDLGDGLVGELLMAELADLNGFRHELFKTLIWQFQAGMCYTGDFLLL